MKTVEGSKAPTSGCSARKTALEACLVHHKERLAYCLDKCLHGHYGAEGHERCIKWLTLALEEESCGLMVTRELHVGYYLNESLCNQTELGIAERSAGEYHARVLEAHEREVYVVTTDGQAYLPTVLTAEGRVWA